MILTKIYRWPDLLKLASLVLIYALLAKMVITYLAIINVISLVWPLSGLGIAVLVIGGKKYWPGIFLGTFIGNLMFDPSVSGAFFIAIRSILEALVGVHVLDDILGFRAKLTRPLDYLRLSVAAVISAGLGASLDGVTLMQSSSITPPDFAKQIVQWWMSDTLDIIVMTPLILIWQRVPRGWFKREKLLETFACFGLALLTGQIVFLGWYQETFSGFAKGYFMFVFLTWSALRFDRHAVTLIIFMAAIQALSGAVNQVGYFADDIAKTGLLNYWFFIMVLTLIGVTMALIIYARDQSNQALQEQKDFLNTILENEPECVKVISLDGKLLQMNQAGLDMLEVESLNALQKYSLADFVLTEDRVDFMNLFKEIRMGNTASLEFRIKGLRGTIRWLDLHATGLRDKGGQVNALLGVTRDITERKKAEVALAKKNEELERSNAELQQFAYVASHDLQEPLRMVSSYTQLLARRYKGKLDQDAEDFIGYAVDGANRMHDLINDLLTYSQVGSHSPNFVRTDFNEVLKQILALLQCSITESAANITFDPLPTVWADTRMIIQLLQNLLSNAIKFHGSLPPQIHIGAYQNQTEWVFSVKDQGIGIAEDQFERMFVIFQRGHSRAEYPGTGIGLALCKRIVEYHGGRIWVESTLGQGATFWFSLPHHHSDAL